MYRILPREKGVLHTVAYDADAIHEVKTQYNVRRDFSRIRVRNRFGESAAPSLSATRNLYQMNLLSGRNRVETLHMVVWMCWVEGREI